MPFIIIGKLCGEFCDDCDEPLADVLVRAYRLHQDAPATSLVAADPKETFTPLSPDVVEAKKEFLLAEARTDENGAYRLAISEDVPYKGEALEIDLYVERVPGQKKNARSSEPRQFTLTTLQPRWRERENDLVAVWDYCLPFRFWCAIRALFDAWVICGRVLDCEKQQPVGNVQVTAFDADWLTDDTLGTATTDLAGRFRIDYSSADFQVTFLSPWINVETPFPPFNSGPDVYFKVEGGGGFVLLNETRPDGHAPGRDNVSPCLCVTLCVEIPGGGDDEELMPGVWTKVGDAFTIPPVLGPTATFDAAGYAGPAKYAIHGRPRLLGSAPRTSNGNPVEYRFLVSDSTTPNGGPPPPAGAFTRIVGASPNENLFSTVEIGQLIRVVLSPFSVTILPVEAQLGDLDPDGWLDVNVSIERTFNDAGIPLADRPAFSWVDLDTLMAINTNPLTTEPNVPNGVAGPGDPVPPANFINIEKVAVRFEIREVVNKPANVFIPFAASGTTLNAMVINNNSTFMKLAMTEHLSSTACNTLSGPVHVAYTLYHPHLMSASLHIRSNDNSINTGLADAGPPALPIAGNTNPVVAHANNSALSVNPPLTLHRCTYIVTLNVRRRLHNGDDAVSNQQTQTSFFWEP